MQWVILISVSLVAFSSKCSTKLLNSVLGWNFGAKKIYVCVELKNRLNRISRSNESCSGFIDCIILILIIKSRTLRKNNFKKLNCQWMGSESFKPSDSIKSDSVCTDMNGHKCSSLRQIFTFLFLVPEQIMFCFNWSLLSRDVIWIL